MSLVTIGRDQTILEAAKMMEIKKVGSLVVTSGSSPVGILTERDIVRKVIAQEKPLDIHLSLVMSTPLLTIDPEDSITDAAGKMMKHKIRRLPVVRNGELLGIVTTTDFSKHLAGNNITEEILKAMSRRPR